jgi:type IV secretion system protein VirD4
VKYYQLYRKGSGKTLKSIQITLAARLEKFNLEAMEKLTATDELEIEKMGEEKTALFIIIPDSDTSFNFLGSILYTQLFQTLFYRAENVYGGSLPTHVHFILDEFANVALPSDFEKYLSTMRSRGVSVSIILQNMAQLKALFEKQWESIVGNCDEFLYLGGNEASTHKYVSEMLGKATLDMNTFGKSTGHSGNYSTNYQLLGRELLTPDEVRKLDNRYALLFIRGELPVMDEKYDILKHPNIELTADGQAEPFDHGTENRSVANIRLIDMSAIKPRRKKYAPKLPEPRPGPDTEYALLAESDMEKYFKQNNQEGQTDEKPIQSVQKEPPEQPQIGVKTRQKRP